MLVVQSRNGAPVLAYSETLADVSRNSTGSEVVRGLGYWLFYIRDAFGPTTTAAEPYLVSGRAILVSYLVTLVGLAGLSAVAWRDRRFAGWLTITGLILAVGVHPITSASPLMRLLLGDDQSGLALALRSSTRAVPLLVLGLALGTGALVDRLPTAPLAATDRVSSLSSLPSLHWLSWRTIGAFGAIGLALANLPALWQFHLVDPAIDRDENVPAAWTDAAAALDEGPAGFRVLQLPGAEFGAFDWGYTVDQPLVALTDRPVVTRDLLPLGATPAMDLLYALDDRIQEGSLEPDAVAPVSRLFGVDRIWLAGDLDALRFRTPLPAVVDGLLTSGGADGLSDAERFGEVLAPVAAASLLDSPLLDAADLSFRDGNGTSPVVLVSVDEPEPIVRAKTDVVILSGSGDGIVDAAAVGLLDGHQLIRYSGSLPAGSIDEALRAADAVIVTDSNRDRAHHWRTSQDVVGHTEPGGPGIDVLVPTASDQRLETFDDTDAALQTVAIQHGPVQAIASAYGEPFAYRPEERAVMAIDGDPDTAWLVGDHADPVGEFIRLVPDTPIDGLVLHQRVPDPGGRSITAVSVVVEGRDEHVALTDDSLNGIGQRVAVTAPAGASIDISIDAVSAGDPALLTSRAAVGFSEIDLGLGPTTELIRPPVDALDALATAGDVDLSVVFSRLRVAATDPWRSDPEPELQRLLPLAEPVDADVSLVLRLDARITDRLLDGLLGAGGAVADRHLLGSLAHRGAAAVDGDPATSWLTPFDDILGATLVVPQSGDVRELTVRQPVGATSTITELSVSSGDDQLTVTVPAPAADGSSTIPLPRALNGSQLSVTITAITPWTAIERRYGDVITLPAGISELTAAGIDVLPVDRAAAVVANCSDEFLVIDGAPLPVSFATTAGALLDGDAIGAEICDAPLRLAAGDHTIVSAGRRTAGLTVDHVILRSPNRAVTAAESPLVTVVKNEPRDREVSVACPDGCWLVFGEGYNTAWQARSGGSSLGPPQLVDGGFNGWWLPPDDAVRTIALRWTAQRPVTIGIVFSVLAACACATILLLGRRTRAVAAAHEPTTRGPSPVSATNPLVGPAVLAVLGGVLIAPAWALAASPSVACPWPAVVSHADGATARWPVSGASRRSERSVSRRSPPRWCGPNDGIDPCRTRDGRPPSTT